MLSSEKKITSFYCFNSKNVKMILYISEQKKNQKGYTANHEQWLPLWREIRWGREVYI